MEKSTDVWTIRLTILGGVTLGLAVIAYLVGTRR